MRSIIVSALVFGSVLSLSSVAKSQSVLHAHIDGDGYFRFVQDGKMAYAKSVDLTVTEGRLGLATGAKLVPTIAVSSLNGLSIDLEGNISSGGAIVGRIVLAIFPTELTGFNSIGLASSILRPQLGNPGEGSNGVVRTGNQQVSTTKSKSLYSAQSKGTVPTSAGHTEQGSLTKSGGKAVQAPSTIGNAEGQSIKITVQDRVEIDSESILLGEIAEIEGPKSTVTKISLIDLGTAPPLNVDRIVDRMRVEARLKAIGIAPGSFTFVGPDKVKVSRKGQKVTHEQFVEAALRGAQLKGYGNLEAISLGPQLKAPTGELQLVCESVTSTTQELSVTVGAYVDGKRFNSRTVKFKSNSVALRAGAIVSVKVKRNTLSVESKGKVLKTDPVSGQVTVQIVDTGAILTGTALADGSVEVKA